MVVPGTYHTVDSSPVGPFETVKAIYNGMLNGGGVIFFVFIAYAAIGLIISTGAFNGLVAGLLKILQGKARAIIIPVFILVLGCASSTIGVFEEAFPFIPIFVGIAIAMGYDAVVGLAIVALGVGLGYSWCGYEPIYRWNGTEHRRITAAIRCWIPYYLPPCHDCCCFYLCCPLCLKDSG